MCISSCTLTAPISNHGLPEHRHMCPASSLTATQNSWIASDTPQGMRAPCGGIVSLHLLSLSSDHRFPFCEHERLVNMSPYANAHLIIHPICTQPKPWPCGTSTYVSCLPHISIGNRNRAKQQRCIRNLNRIPLLGSRQWTFLTYTKLGKVATTMRDPLTVRYCTPLLPPSPPLPVAIIRRPNRKVAHVISCNFR